MRIRKNRWIFVIKENTYFSAFITLTNPEMHEGLKVCSDWVKCLLSHANGELVSWLDIVKEMTEDDNDLKETLGFESKIELSSNSPLHSLAHKAKAMLLMKGNLSGKTCEFSRKIVELLTFKSIGLMHIIRCKTSKCIKG